MRRVAPIVALGVAVVGICGAVARADPHATARARRNVDGVLIAAGAPGALVRAEIFCPAPGSECAFGVQALLALARREPDRLRVTVAITPLMDGDDVARAAVEAARTGHLEDWLRLVAREPRRAALPGLILEAGLDPRRAASATHDRVLAAAARRAASLGLMTTRAMVVYNGESEYLPGVGQIEDRVNKAERTARQRLDAGVPRDRLARTIEDEARRDRAPRPLGVDPRPRRRLPPLEQRRQSPAARAAGRRGRDGAALGRWRRQVAPGDAHEAREAVRERDALRPQVRALRAVERAEQDDRDRRARVAVGRLLERLGSGRRPMVADRNAYAALAGVDLDPACTADVTRDATLAADLGLVAPPVLFVNGLELARTHQLREQVALELLPGALADLAEEGRGVLSAPPAR